MVIVTSYVSASGIPTTTPIYEATCTTATDITTTGTSDVTGCTVTVTANSTSDRFVVNGCCDVAHQDATSSVFSCMLTVDSTAQSNRMYFNGISNGVRVTMGKTWIVTGLSAGSHTFKFQATQTAASSYRVQVGSNFVVTRL